MIDTHMHVDTRPYEDFETMALAGITDVLTLAHDPLRMSASVVLADHFERLFAERRRVEKNGIRLHVCLGIHPRACPTDLEASLSLLDSCLSGVVALGETGMESTDRKEAELFSRHIEMGIKHRLPIIAHTPRSNKAFVTREILNVLSTYTINKDSVVIDHADETNIKLILDRGFNAGLTIQPGKLTPAQAVALIKKSDADRLVLNTDASSNMTDILGVPRTVHLMRLERLDESIIAGISRMNAKRIFGI